MSNALPQPSAKVPQTEWSSLYEQQEHKPSNGSHVALPSFSKLANPAPLGLFGFSVTSIVVGLYNCGAGLPDSNPRGSSGPDQAAFGLALFMGGMIQIIVGFMEFRSGNTLGTTIHSSYGAYWMAYAMLKIPGLHIREAYGDERSYTFALGIFLIIWVLLTIVFMVASLHSNILCLLVFVFLALSYLFAAIANFIATSLPEQSIQINKVGGGCGVVCGMIAFYCAAAGLMSPEMTPVRLPLGPAPWAKEHIV
ncbi:putative FUN34 - transmembrane protein involved in ammonia production [Trichophyton interdigitale]|uniref:FUN34 - transmembrane protein involved in ammonia production n=1 Tax=Trichophyton interdigitale TaxID=101480 RepID=A0A9P5CV80_9EURO|nr:putative FUN34 - transmembrane protein involved in ammonia production [Trichophyton interdigitale]KAF3896384.1 putative FUN34 - transmembrane protein involved in ammonia production [Trichophyton interdigitale]KAG8210436.1 putative FUN34 - transmembrane protein involved in ammonia production [Trichophyton interdigitale]